MLLSGSHVLFCFLSLIFRPTINFRNWFLESKCSNTKVHHIHKMIFQPLISDYRTFSEEISIGLCPLNDLCIEVLFKLLAFWSTFENISCVPYNILYFSGTLITKSKFLGFFCFQYFFFFIAFGFIRYYSFLIHCFLNKAIFQSLCFFFPLCTFPLLILTINSFVQI